MAVGGPAEWSVRIGVYGEWGTGKTSVLKFVESMAHDEKHIIVWFDPWGLQDPAEVWRSFADNVSAAIAAAANDPRFGLGGKLKSFGVRARDFIQERLKKSSGEIAGAAAIGTDLLMGWLQFGAADLEKLKADLGDRRVLVLIDDLDRTQAELVPRILFALKEILDLPGFSFVCGFDPEVISKVLESRHEGFGGGLKFLEKIIDYPVWLPPPTLEGLAKIALSDAEHHAPFVPKESLRRVLDLLPGNPRSVRQFVRLISLLEDQVERYGEGELNWWVVLASNAIRARWPKVDASKLLSEEFYEGYMVSGIFGHPDQKNRKEFIMEHVSECCQEAGIGEMDQIEALCAAMKRLCDGTSVWGEVGTGGLSGQACIATCPQILTIREFHQITECWESPKSIETVKNAILKHADRQGFSGSEVLSTLVPYLIKQFDHEAKLSQAAFTAADARRHRKTARRAIDLLEVLLLRPGDLVTSSVTGIWIPIEELFDKLLPLADSGGAVHRESWPKISKLLLNLIKVWDGDVMPLVAAVRAYGPHMGKGFHLNGKASVSFAKELIIAAEGRLAELVITQFSMHGFLKSVSHHQETTRPFYDLIFDHDSILWTHYRFKFLKTIKQAGNSMGGRENAHEFVEWLTHFLSKSDEPFLSQANRIMNDHEFVHAIWTIATSKPLQGVYAYQIREFPQKAELRGIKLHLPSWWQAEIDAFETQINAERALREGHRERSNAEGGAEPTKADKEE